MVKKSIATHPVSVILGKLAKFHGLLEDEHNITADHYQRAIDDKEVRAKLAAVFHNQPVDHFHSAAMQALLVAVNKGVTEVTKGVYEFEDPGLSYKRVFDLPITREKELIRAKDWLHDCKWTETGDTPQKRRIRLQVEGSFNKNFDEQILLLDTNETVAEARVLVMLHVINALSTRMNLPSAYVRCIETIMSHRLIVSYFPNVGVDVSKDLDDYRCSGLGIAAAQKV